MRPTPEILDTISKLAELNPIERQKAILTLTFENKNLEDSDVQKYVIDRLVSGLSSSRAAVRLGYSTSLIRILSTKMGESWSFGKLLDIAQKKMDLADKTVASSNAIGHYLLLTCYLKTGKFTPDEVRKMAEHSKKVRDVAMNMSFAIASFLQSLSSKVQSDVFSENIYPTLEVFLDGFTSLHTPESVYLALSLRKTHYKEVSKYAKFVKKDGTCDFSEDVCKKILFALKKCDSSNFQIVFESILVAAIESNSFAEVYKHIAEPWALSSNEAKVIDRLKIIVEDYFKLGGNAKSIGVVFSKEVLNRMETAMRGKGQLRLLRSKVQSFGQLVQSKLQELKGDDAYELLKFLSVQGNVDKATGVSITTTLLSKLEKKQVLKWVKDNINNQEETRKIVSAFGEWEEKSKVAVLNYLLEQTATETTQMVVTSIVDSQFYVKTRAGEFASFQLSENNEKTLKQLVATAHGEEIVKSAEKVISKSKLRSNSLLILWYVIKLWEKVAPTAEEKSSYEEDANEVLAIAKNEKDGNNSKVFVDLLISILSKEKKYHRTPVSYAFVHALGTLSAGDITHIVETAMMGESELMGEEEDVEDEEGMPFDPSEISQRNEENSDSDEVDDEEDEEEENINESVDQELLDKLNEALGDAKDNGSDAEMDDLDDHEMMKMDERLAAAFKAMAPKANVEALKMKLADLLLIAISSKTLNEKIKINLIVPLLKWARTDSKKHGQVAEKALELVKILIKIKMTLLNEKEAVSLFTNVINEAQNSLAYMPLVDTAGEVVAFLIKTTSDGSKIAPLLRAEYSKLFDNYLKNVEGKVPSNLVILPIATIPKLFVNELPMLIDAGFDEDNRIFKRTEIIGAAAAVCNKNVLRDTPVPKAVLKKVSKKISSYFEKVLQTEKSDIKPRLFGTVLQLIVNLSLAIAEDEDLIETLKEGLESVLKKITEGEEFSKLKKLSPVCHHIIGRSVAGAFTLVKKTLDITE